MEACRADLEAVAKRVEASAKKGAPIDAPLQVEVLDAVCAARENASVSPKEDLQACQRKVEDHVTKFLYLGVGPPIRVAASELLCELFTRGDNIALYSCVGKLQDWLNGKEARKVSDGGKASILRCLGRLVDVFGTQLGSGFQESLTIAQKLYKNQSAVVREEALLMLASYVSVCTRDRFACQAQEQSLKLAERGSRDKSESVRCASSRLLAAVGFAGGQGLFTNGTAGFDEAVRVCLRGIEDPSRKVAASFSDALGEVTSCTASTSAQAALGACKEAKRPQLGKVLENPTQILCAAFLRSLAEGKGRTSLCLTLALRRCFRQMRSRYHCGDDKLCFVVTQALEALNGVGTKGPANAVPLAQACLVYFFHSGPLEVLGNASHAFLLGRLAKLMDKYKQKASLAFRLGILQCSRLLIQKLGSVEEEEAEGLLKLILPQLSHDSELVLQEAALASSSLLFAYPKISERAINTHLERLNAATAAGGKNKAAGGALGHGFALAAALSVVSKLELGIPERLLRGSFRFCELACSAPDASGPSATRAAYAVLASLLSVEDAVDMPPRDLLKFFDPLTGDKAALHARWKKLKGRGLLDELESHGSALRALESLARRLVADEKQNAQVLQFLSQLLAQYLSALVEAPIAGKAGEELALTIQQLQLSLVRAFAVLPVASSAPKAKQQFLKVCAVSFQVAGVQVPRSSLLRRRLCDLDASLGPWGHGYDELEDELWAYEGSLLSPRFSFDDPGTLSAVFHHSLSTETALLDTSLELITKLFAHLKWKEQKYFLELVVHAMKQSLNVGRSEKRRLHRDAIFTNAACALLGLLGVLKDATFKKDAKAAVVNALLPCAKILLEEGVAEPQYVRASAEVAAGVCDFGGENIAKSLVKSLCQEQVGGQAPDSVKGLVLWLGAIGRSLGGISLTGLQDGMVKKLQQIVGSGIDEAAQVWLLHSYWLIATASGPAFIQHVSQMLNIATQVSVLSTGHEAALLQTVARIGNAVVGILGPEFSPGKFAFRRSNVLIDGAKGAEGGDGAQLEQVLHIQQLLLFAPHVSTTSALLGILKPFLRTGQPAVRMAAAKTLRHLAETNPFSLAEEGVEHDVISALDRESEPEIQATLRRVFIVVMEAGCGEVPTRWIQFCQNIILNETGSAGVEGTGGFGDDEDDDEDGGGGFGGGGEAEEPAEAEATGSCLETREFVMECLCSVFRWVGDDGRHWDVSKAQGSPDGDWMVLKLQNLVNSGYKICTGNLPTLQPKGIHLLNILVEKFGDQPDPDYEGHQLMEQYQAQLLSALRSAFEKSALPTMTTVGLELAASLIEKNILSSDIGTLKRVVALMCKCLDYFDPQHEVHYSDSVVDRLKIGAIESLSKLICHCGGGGGGKDPSGGGNEDLLGSLSPQNRAVVSRGCVDLSSDYLARAFIGEDGPRFSYQSKFIKSSRMRKSRDFLRDATGLGWLRLIEAFLLSSDGESLKDSEAFVCTAAEFALTQAQRGGNGEPGGASHVVRASLGILSELFRTCKRLGGVIAPTNCSRVLRTLDSLLRDGGQLLGDEDTRKSFLDCAATVVSGFPSDYLLVAEIREKTCRLACRCVAEFCDLGRGLSAEGGPLATSESVSGCAKVWEALLDLSVGSLGTGGAETFRYCLQNAHFVFRETTSDAARRCFAGILLRCLREVKEALGASSSSLGAASCGLSFAHSFVEKVRERSLHSTYTDNAAVTATLCLSVVQQICKVDFPPGSAAGKPISGLDLATGLFHECLGPQSPPKLRCLVLQIWNKDVAQSLADSDWVARFVACFAPAAADATSSAITAVASGRDAEPNLALAVEGLKFFGVCLNAFATNDEPKAIAVGSLALPLLYQALTMGSSSTNKAAGALAMAANKIFNLFAAKGAAAAKAFVQGLPQEKRQALTKGLQESGAAAKPAASAAGRRANQPGRIKKPTIALKSFGVK